MTRPEGWGKDSSAHKRFAPKKPVDQLKVYLTCGHFVRVQLSPLHPNVKYACGQNTGCGYRLPWVRFETHDGTTITNRLFRDGGAE